MRAQFEPLPLDGFSYDPRTVAAALEALVLRSAIAGRGSRDAGLAAAFLLDYEAVLDDRARRVHSVAFESDTHGRVCSCGLVMYALDPATASGHLDTDTWRRTQLIVVAHQSAAHPPDAHQSDAHQSDAHQSDAYQSDAYPPVTDHSGTDHSGSEPAAFSVVCHACGWSAPARSAAEGHSRGQAHGCDRVPLPTICLE